MNILITSNHHLESFLESTFVRKSNGLLVSNQSGFVFFEVDHEPLLTRFLEDIRIECCVTELGAKKRFIDLLERRSEEKFVLDNHAGLPGWCAQAFLESGWKGELQTLWNPWIFTKPPQKVLYNRVFRVCQTAQLYLLSLVTENKSGDPQEWSYEMQRYLKSHVGSRFGQTVGICKVGGVLSYEFVVSKLGVQSYLSGSIILGEMESDLQRWGVETLRDFETAVKEIQNGMESKQVQKQVQKQLPAGSIVKIEPLWAKTLWLKGSPFYLEDDGAYYIQAWVKIQGQKQSGEPSGILRMSNVIRIEQNQCDFEYVFLPEMIHVP